MSASRVNSATVSAALAALDAGATPSGPVLRDAVRALLTALRAKAPGRSVEVRVPPYGAIQCAEGPVHTRGTPPNVIEMDAPTFVLLSAGRLSWGDALRSGQVVASGSRADLSAYLPLWTGDTAPPAAPGSPVGPGQGSEADQG